MKEPELKTCAFPGCTSVIPVAWYGFIEFNPIVPAATAPAEIEEIKREMVDAHRGELCWKHFQEAHLVLKAWLESGSDGGTSILRLPISDESTG